MKPLAKAGNALALAILAAAGIGFIDAVYLSAKYLAGAPVPCVLGGGCDAVTRSAYAEIAGVPVAVLGAAFYFSVFLAGLLFRERGSRALAIALAALGAGGLLVSLWLVSVQAFILKAFCSYCLFSAAASVSIAILAGFLLRVSWRRQSASV